LADVILEKIQGHIQGQSKGQSEVSPDHQPLDKNLGQSKCRNRSVSYWADMSQSISRAGVSNFYMSPTK